LRSLAYRVALILLVAKQVYEIIAAKLSVRECWLLQRRIDEKTHVSLPAGKKKKIETMGDVKAR